MKNYIYISNMSKGKFYLAFLSDIRNKLMPISWTAGLSTEEVGQMMGGN